METPNTLAGELTEAIMVIFRPMGVVKVQMPALTTQQYNALWSHVLHVLSTREKPTYYGEHIR